MLHSLQRIWIHRKEGGGGAGRDQRFLNLLVIKYNCCYSIHITVLKIWHKENGTKLRWSIFTKPNLQKWTIWVPTTTIRSMPTKLHMQLFQNHNNTLYTINKKQTRLRTIKGWDYEILISLYQQLHMADALFICTVLQGNIAYHDPNPNRMYKKFKLFAFLFASPRYPFPS